MEGRGLARSPLVHEDQIAVFVDAGEELAEAPPRLSSRSPGRRLM